MSIIPVSKSTSTSESFAPKLLEPESLDSLPGLVRTVPELKDAALSLINRRRREDKAPSGVPVQQQVQVAGSAAARLVDLDRLGKDLIPLESLRRPTAPETQAARTEIYSRKDFFETILSDVVSSSLESLKEEMDARILKQFDSDWESARARILQQLGSKDAPAPIVSNAASEATRQVKPNPLEESSGAPKQVRKEETPKMIEFYKELRGKNNDGPVAMCYRFREASRLVGSNLDACELWNLIRYFVDKSNYAMARDLAPRNILLKRALAARAFLEQQYRERRGGQGQPINDDLFWESLPRSMPTYEKVFRICRAGSWEYGAKKARDFDPNLQAYLVKFQKLQNGTFDASDDGDAYKQALAGLNNPEFKPAEGVIANIEDFLWMRLCSVTFAMDDEQKALGLLKSLTASLIEFGPDYFEAGANPFLYARILATCGAIELAINHLALFSPVGSAVMNASTAVSDPLPEAVHLAIVLFKGQALQIAQKPPANPSMLVDEDNKLHVPMLLEMYSARFTDPEKAIFYATCLPPPVSESDCLPAKKILARPLPHGGPLPLLKILKVNLDDDKSAAIAMSAARESRSSDAISIYREAIEGELFPPGKLDEMRDNAYRLVAKELARVMDMESSHPERRYWKAEADRFKVSAQKHSYSSQAVKVFETVLKCAYFFDDYLKGDEDAPLKLESWLLPNSTLGSHDAKSNSLNQTVNSFIELDRVVKDAFPAIVGAVVECHEAAFGRGKRDEAKARLGTLMDFIAALKAKDYRLRSDIERRLTQANSRIRI